MPIPKIILKNKIKIIFFSFLIILSVILRSINLLVIPISIIILNKILSPIFSRKIFNSKFFILSVISFCYIILLQCTVLIGWLINTNFSLDLSPMLLLLFLIITCIFNKKLVKSIPKQDKDNIKLLNVYDIISIIIATFLIAIISLPPICSTNNSNRLSVFLISNTASSSDDSGHMIFLNDNIQFNIGVIHNSYAENKTRSGGFYPSTWSAISAVITKTVNPTIVAGKDTLIAYVILKLFWLLVLCFFITRVSFGIINHIIKNELRRATIFSTAIFSLFFCYLFVIPFSIEGAYSFLPQIISTILLIPFLIQFGTEKLHRSFLLIMILGIGGCLAWFLSLPAFLLAIVIIAVYVSANKYAEITLTNLYKLIRYSLPIYIIILIAISIQFLLLTLSKSSDSVSLVNGLLLDGARTTHTEIYYLFYFIGFIAFCSLIHRNKSKSLYPILFLVTSLICYVGFVFTLQNCMNNKSQYYYFKLFDVLLSVFIPLCIAGFVVIIDRYSKNRGKIIGILISIIFISVSFQILDRDTNSRLYYIGGARAISKNISKIIVDELSSDASIKNYNKKEYTIFYTSPNNKAENKHATKFLKNKPLSECGTKLEGTIYSSSSISEVLGTIEDFCKDYKISIITNKSSSDYFERVIKSKNLSEKVNVEIKI